MLDRRLRNRRCVRRTRRGCRRRVLRTWCRCRGRTRRTLRLRRWRVRWTRRRWRRRWRRVGRPGWRSVRRTDLSMGPRHTPQEIKSQKRYRNKSESCEKLVFHRSLHSKFLSSRSLSNATFLADRGHSPGGILWGDDQAFRPGRRSNLGRPLYKTSPGEGRATLSAVGQRTALAELSVRE